MLLSRLLSVGVNMTLVCATYPVEQDSWQARFKGPFTSEIYYAIAMTLMFKNGVSTHFCDCNWDSYSYLRKESQSRNKYSVWINHSSYYLCYFKAAIWFNFSKDSESST